MKIALRSTFAFGVGFAAGSSAAMIGASHAVVAVPTMTIPPLGLQMQSAVGTPLAKSTLRVTSRCIERRSQGDE